MPIGIVADVAAVVLGGLAGSLVGTCLSESRKQILNWIFGLCAMAMGISAVVLMVNMPAVVFSVIAGTLLGLALGLGSGLNKLTEVLLNRLSLRGTEERELMVTAVVLFCASGTGIYGALDAGMSGNQAILMAKAVLDFFTAMIFACRLGKTTCLIGLPQFVIFMLLYLLAKKILPLTNETMILDFKACGGFLLLATGLRMMQLRQFPVADMIPAMLLVMPVSYLWSHWLQPLFS